MCEQKIPLPQAKTHSKNVNKKQKWIAQLF